MRASFLAPICALIVLGVVSSQSASADGDWPTLPDHDLTPGKVRSDLSAADICDQHWGEDQRHVTQRMKDEVVAAYNFDVNACPFTVFDGQRKHRVEIDHLISRELGGADDVANLWPECYEPIKANKNNQADGAHKKDRLENKLHKQLCANPSDRLLKKIQHDIAADWIALYHRTYPDE